MELITYQTDGSELKQKRAFIRDGISGNYDVAIAMIRLIRAGTKERGLEKFAKALIISNKLDSYSDASDILKTVFDFVRKNTIYTLDIAGNVDVIKSARITLSDGYGDCDDLTVLIATLLGCLGFENVKLVLARYFENDTAFSHIYAVCYIEGKRFVLDATLPENDFQFNDELKAVEVKEIPVFSFVNGLDGVSGIFTNTKYLAKKFGKSALDAVPTATTFLPLGFLSSAAFSGGAMMLAQNKNELSINALGSKINQELDKIIFALQNQTISYDIAKNLALQYSAQLNATSGNRDANTYKTIKNSIKSKLDIINNFEQKTGITPVNLNPELILLLGAAGLSYGGYKLYQHYKG